MGEQTLEDVVDLQVSNGSKDIALVQSTSSTSQNSELYDLQMVMGCSHRRMKSSEANVDSMVMDANKGGFTTYDSMVNRDTKKVIAIDMQNHIVRNVAYLTSNPEKKLKASRKVLKKADVVPMVMANELDSIGEANTSAMTMVPNTLKGDASRALLPTDRSPVMDRRRPYRSDVTNQDGSRPLVEQ
ncbi:hypothetical protein V6N13_042837 [Hibiscus sabdariffa]